MAALLAGMLALTPLSSGAQTEETERLPAGVRVETVLPGMKAPVAFAFDPGGRIFYTEKSGAVRLFASGKLQPEPVITFEVSTGPESETGLLGIAIDPDFQANRQVYVYYTCLQGSSGCQTQENRVVRFAERNGAGSNPTVIFSTPQAAPAHAGGNIHFGPDGKLYVTVGDNGNAATAQDVTRKSGKIHRLNPDGSAPPDNPRFEGAGALPTIYAIGLRNSFDFTFDPVVRGRIFASENGPNCDDEMNRIEAGGNYGWRDGYPCDDRQPDPQYNTINPLWYVPKEPCCLSPTGIEVYRGSQIPEWRNHLFMASFNVGALYHFTLNDTRTRTTSVRIVDGVKAHMDLETGPDGALYFIEGGGWYPEGTLKRIVSTSQATPTPMPPPARVPGEGSQTFPETKKTVSGLFLDYWRNNGGLPQQGFPISDVMGEVSPLDQKPYTVQYFERAVFEYHPEQQDPRFKVLLSQLGTFQYRKKYPQGAPNQTPNNMPGSVLFPETGKRLGGRFLQYWQQNGGLAQQGFPISEEFTEVSDLNGKEYRVQYFERAVFEMHPENQPPYDVLLSQLGTFQLKEKYGR